MRLESSYSIDLYQFRCQFPPFQYQFQQDSRFRFDGCQLDVRKMKLLQPKLKVLKIVTRQHKMIVIIDTFVNSISEASL